MENENWFSGGSFQCSADYKPSQNSTGHACELKTDTQIACTHPCCGVFWCGLSNAWLAILAYHAQIIFWSRPSLSNWHRPRYSHTMLLALPCVLAGPMLYFLLPYITHQPLSIWLQNHHLSRISLLILIPYFGLLHPVLEQLHWTQLRQHTPISHAMFAGYHMVVLYTLLKAPWLILCFGVLLMASWTWQQMARKNHSLAGPMLSHILADLGIIVAAWLYYTNIR